MSARLIDDARAFDIIAPYLTDERRAEIAESIAARMAQPGRQTGSQVTAVRQPHGSEAGGLRTEYELAAHDPVVKFLKALGYAEGELVRAAARLWSAVRADRDSREVAALTEPYLAGLWNRITEEARPDAG